jgi:hypothetical protein
MFNSQSLRKFCLAVAAAALFALAGCSNQATDQATKQTPAPAKKAAAAKPASAPKPAAGKPAANVAKAAPAAGTTVTVPKGTAISATVGQTLATNKNKVGDTFAASLATPVTVDGKTIIPKGAPVTGRIVTIKKHELKVTLASVVIGGKSYPLETNSVAGSKSQAKNKATQTDVKSTDKSKAEDVTVLSAKSQVTFKLAKPLAIPVKQAKAAKTAKATKATAAPVKG